jgi:hypothetical protein
MVASEKALPDYLISRATLRGSELAWPIADIPEVIEAGRLAGLVSIGGQLQFRFPDGITCECYWVEVDTYRTVSSDLPRSERVTRTAAAALSMYATLQSKYDFSKEGREGFGEHVDRFEASGGCLIDAMCFVWYFEDQVTKKTA